MKKSNYLTVNINFNLGLFLFNLGAYNKALNKFKNCVTDEKYKSQSQFLMGKSYYYIREYDQALKSFSLAAGNNYKTDETKRYISHIYNISKVKKKK
jgi:tetratricopeptide (TPR) repeat protein